MDTEERLQQLERKTAEHDRLISVLIAYAKTTAAGRAILKILAIA